MLATIEQFVQFARGLTAAEIYNLFEFETADSLRDQILNLADSEDPEPVRTALRILGQSYCVPELECY